MREISYKHQFLTIIENQLGEEAARKSVSTALMILNPKITMDRNYWKSGELSFDGKNGKKVIMTIPSLVQEAKQKGIPTSLYKIIDNKDKYFGRDLELATNMSVKVNISFAGYSKEVQGPCRSSPMGIELTEDILFYRREACNTSNIHDFLDCTRHYRAFLQSSVSLVEYFLNRHIIIREYNNPGSIPKELKSAMRFEDKIDLWTKVIVNRESRELKQGQEWLKLTEIRKKRNKLVHVTEPYFGVSIKEMPKLLNYTQDGIGGFLLLLRKMTNQGTLGFIERLRNAPEVTFKAK